MPHLFLPDLRLHYTDTGPAGAPALVLSHALGLDLTMWAAVLPQLPPGLRVICYDHRGHGGSDVPAPPYTMGALIRDAERLLDHLGVTDCVFAGISMGGLVAQGLAVKRLDLVRGLVLSNTAARIGHAGAWAQRAELVTREGMVPLIGPTMQRWFPRRFRATGGDAPWAARLAATSPEGYAGCCAAIGGTDFYTPTAGLRLPVQFIAGGEDGSTPADLMRETFDLIPGAGWQLLRGAGHLPPIDAPGPWAATLTAFLTRIGHI